MRTKQLQRRFFFRIGLVLCSISWLFLFQGRAAPARQNPPPKLQVDDSSLKPDVKAGATFAPIVKKVAPSVVNIYSTMTIRERPGLSNPLFDDPFFRRFFGEDSGEDTPRTRKAQSLGSGVIVSADGYILTANHVVEGADQVKVAFATGQKEFDAKVVGTDPPTDVALLKIEGKNFSPIVIADSDKLEVGDVVLAIGNPFAVGQTVTMGIVSGIGRGGFNINAYENFIQTDAAINPGNSGGALVDAEGRLVGINTAIFSRSGGNMGVGFAVPINMARAVMNQLVTQGKVTRGYLGINIQPLTAELAKELGLPADSGGVLVGDVTSGSAAEKAGIKDGDVLLEINGKKVTDPRSVQLAVAQEKPGTKVTLHILRAEGGHKPVEKTVTATLAALPEEYLSSENRHTPTQRQGSQSMDALDGVEVTDLDTRTRRRFEIPNNIRGALVTNVQQDSNAAEAGLRPGDVIVEINRQTVRNAEDAVTLSQKIKGDHVLLRVWSSSGGGGPGGTHWVVIKNSSRTSSTR